MQDHKNTIAGWVLFAGIIVLGASIVTGEVFHSERPEKMGFPIEGVVLEGEGGAAAEKPMDFSVADVAKGEQVFKKCAACHNADKGGANALGPNLWNVMGEEIGKGAGGFAFSPALAGKGGNWDFNNLGEWLANPKKFAPGTKMTFAGLSNPEDRANVIAFLNAHGDSPRPLPAAPAAAAPAAGDVAADPAAADKSAAETVGAGAQKAPNEKVLNQVDAAKGGPKTSGGDAAKVAQ